MEISSPQTGFGLCRLYFETGHWPSDFCDAWPTGCGRVCEVTNGRFVEAKLEKSALSIGQLWRSLTGGFGSGPASQSPELVARKLPVQLDCHRADVRIDRVPTLKRHPLP